MKYYSTNRRTPEVSLREAVVASMAPDNGLYMPERIERLPDAFFDGIARLDLHRIACRVADAFFGEEIEPETLRRIVRDTFCFDIPVVRVDDGIWALELFHGPTMAFKDVGARFMARILSHFIDLPDRQLPHPDFPFLCLLVSGGHTQIVRVDSPLEMKIIGTTIDDAAGEAFDKCAKVMGLPYPGGPVIDRLAKEGNPKAFRFAHPHVDGYDYSFSGLKTSFLYTLRDAVAQDPDFIERNKADLCASLQATVVEILLDKLIRASKETGIRDIAIGGGVSANSGLRNGIVETGRRRGWRTFIPEFKFTTDNAAMIAMAGYFHYRKGEFASLDVSPVARLEDL